MPAWSPDGGQLAFAVWNWKDWDPRSFDLYVGTSGRTKLRKLTPTPHTVSNPDMMTVVSSPAWSPDGTKIAFTSPKDGQIYTINTDGSQQTKITTTGTNLHATWQPNPGA